MKLGRFQVLSHFGKSIYKKNFPICRQALGNVSIKLNLKALTDSVSIMIFLFSLKILFLRETKIHERLY